MYNTENILFRLNRANPQKSMTLAHIISISFSAFWKEVKDTLNWGVNHHLYLTAKKAEKENRIFEARLLSRANPQLPAI
ncbi:hypothetical protein XBO1_480024 [Xenorhabdus bovienii str. oregonense]|uniref:Uncharacterized protein n=1 Tax=Xenorhabdus bovienii str. oregonense TaxID=1398202 RepID=A0A077PA03_XENBV|nr:hypothetical protein [Xenorhabdus bovienii]CDH07659.1 hypothetical protein XBO1_480024 [Xenorhabdus bovienii str. oregonense]